MINGKRLQILIGLSISTALVVLAIPLVIAESTSQIADNSAPTGRYISIKACNGQPVISYYDVTHQSLQLAICHDATCEQYTIETIDEQTNVGQYSSLALRDGQAIISYYDAQAGDLRLSTCLNKPCTKIEQVIIDEVGQVGQYTSLELPNEIPVISYYDATNGDLKLAICRKLSCKKPDLLTPDQTGDVGQFSSLSVANNQPVVSYYDATNGDLKLAVCDDLHCNNPTLTTIDQVGDVGQFSSLALRNGQPIISYYDATNGDLKLAVCDDLYCNNTTVVIIDQMGDVGRYNAVELYHNRPVISYYDATQHDTKLALCDDLDCTTVIHSVLDSVGNVGLDTALVVDNHDVFVSYHDMTNQTLKLASDILASGCYLNAPGYVNEGDQFTVEIACNRVTQPIFGFQIGHQITTGSHLVTTTDQQFMPGNAFAEQVTLPGPNTLDVYALSLVAGGKQATGAFTLGSVTYTAHTPGKVVLDLANPIFGTIQGDAINNIMATPTSSTIIINDVFRATIKGKIRPENGKNTIDIKLADDPLVENVHVTQNAITGEVDFIYENIQEPSVGLNALAASHTECVQLLNLQDNAEVDLGDQLILLAGDVTDDNAIDMQDTAAISALYGQPPANNEDINQDGVVDVLDLIYVSQNYDTVGPTVCAP